MVDIDSCDHCIYFGITPQAIGDSLKNWCYRHDISTLTANPKCPNYRNHTEFEGDYNPEYLGFIERERERKKYREEEDKRKFYRAVVSSVLAVVIGVILGYLIS